MGIELNPRMGKNFDFKLFTNGRVGMMSWLIVCVSLAPRPFALSPLTPLQEAHSVGAISPDVSRTAG